MTNRTAAERTVGGTAGVVLRRLIHISMIIYPIIYVCYANQIAVFFHLSVTQLIWCIFTLVCLAELCRLRFGILLFAQRRHERKHLSSFTWAALAICIVLIALPNPLYAIPIVATCALGDPLLSFLRGRLCLFHAMLIGTGLLMTLWWIARIWLPMPVWLPVLIAPLAVWSELPNLSWLDDNALMQLVPLVFVLLFV